MDLLKSHARLKRVRGRGTEVQQHLAALRYLKALEAEMEQVRRLLCCAWDELESSRDFRKCSSHMDKAQQRMHKAIKKLIKKRKR